jgi:uncharacterized protein YciI
MPPHNTPIRLLRCLALIVFFFAPPAFAADSAAAQKPAPKKHFLIVLRLAPRLHDDRAWTDADKATVTAHFQRLKAATDAGQVILAGRTPEPGDTTMGLVVFTATDEAAARTFMNDDPCIAAGVMVGELRPFDLALLRKS